MKKFLIYLTSILLVVSIFWTLPVSFFQQDEWHSFGVIQSYGLEYITLGKPLWISLLSDRIGARFIMYALFGFFGVNSIPYGSFSLLIHFLNSFLLFKLTCRATGNKIIGAISAVFFLINSVSDQAYSWFGTMAGSAISVTFILLSLIFYFDFLTKRKYLYNLFSIIFLWISFLFKEVGYFIFIAYPILWLIYTKDKRIKLFIKDNLLVLIYGCVMTVFFVQSVLFIPGVRANYIAPQNSGFVKIINHIVSYPLEGISQIILPPPIIFNLAKHTTILVDKSLQPDTPTFDLFYTTKMAEYVSIAMSILLIIGLLLIYKKFIKKTNDNIRLLFLASVFLLVFSFLPYVVIDKFDAYLDSRYYYASLIGASTVLGITIYSLFKFIKNNGGRLAIASLFVILYLYHGVVLTGNLYRQFTISRDRVNILNQISKIAPVLPKKAIFFITGDSSGFYALPELKVPFQSGLGQILMTVYASKNPAYPILFKEKSFWETADAGFLYDTLAQGYREVGNNGFGYYYERRALEEGLNKKLFNKESVISLFYNSEKKKIIKKNIDDVNL